MRPKPGTKFSVKHPYRSSLPDSNYEVIRVEGKVCVCLDLGLRFVLAMPVAYVKSKISTTKTKNKL